MCPEAARDLHRLMGWTREAYGARRFYFASGSMGGTGNLIYAALYPRDVAAVVALCPVTGIVDYHEWCRAHPGGVRDEIRMAIEAAYGGAPDQVPDRYAKHTVTQHADRLTMPLFLAHATGDQTIPVAQSRELMRCLEDSAWVHYMEIAGGNHDTPLREQGMLDWLERVVVSSRR